jgi:hypothetical protein
MGSMLTKAAIVSTALSIVGNDDIQTKAEGWLDLILRAMALQWRFPDLAKQHTAAVGSGTGTIAYPADYGFLTPDITGGHVGTFTESGGSVSWVYPHSLGMVRDNPSHATGPGTPALVADDRINSRWILHPISNVGGTIALNYQSVPAIVASGAVVWYPNDMLLVEEIVSLAERDLRGSLVSVDIQVKEAAKRLALQSPSRGQLYVNAGPGAGLDRRIFK